MPTVTGDMTTSDGIKRRLEIVPGRSISPIQLLKSSLLYRFNNQHSNPLYTLPQLNYNTISYFYILSLEVWGVRDDPNKLHVKPSLV